MNECFVLFSLYVYFIWIYLPVTVLVNSNKTEYLISSWNIFLDTKLEFTKKLADLKKKIKEKATFVCELNKENVKVIWKKNGKELKSEKNVKIVADKKSHQLIIEVISVEDGGEYSCIAGDISTSAKLAVEGEDMILRLTSQTIILYICYILIYDILLNAV